MSSQVPHLPSSLVLVGAGKMGGAMLEGFLANGMKPAGVTVLDPRPSDDMMRLCEDAPSRLTRLSRLRPKSCCWRSSRNCSTMRQRQVNGILGPQTVIVSVIAGKTIGDLKARLPAATAIIRAMPNLPASVGRGATGAAANGEVSETQRRAARRVASLRRNRRVAGERRSHRRGHGPVGVRACLCVSSGRVHGGGRAKRRPSRRSRGEPRARHRHWRGRVAVSQRAFPRDPSPERHLARRHDRRRAGNPYGRSGGAESADAGCGRCGKAACRRTLWLKQGVAGSARTT